MSGTVSPESTALGYIQASIEGLGKALETDRQHNTTAMNQLQDMVRTVQEQMRSVSVLAAGLNTTEQSLERAWSHVNDHRKQLDEMKLWKGKVVGITIGLGVLYTVVIGLVTFIYLGDRDTTRAQIQTMQADIKATDDRLQRVEIWAAGSHDNAYRR